MPCAASDAQRHPQIVMRDHPTALRMYEEAAAEAEQKGFRYWQGMALVLGASNAAAMGASRITKHLLRDGYVTWDRWGATTLTSLLARRHPFLYTSAVQTSTSSSSSATLGPFSNLNVQLGMLGFCIIFCSR